jgi:meiosis-specific transcription factor NDT80
MNYFAVTISFGLTPWMQNGRLYLNRGGKGPEQIMSMAVALAAAIDNSGGKTIKLIQNTRKNHNHNGYSLHRFPQNTTIAGPQLPLQNESDTSHS